jgi:preprotein translocase subunit YajC
MGEPAADLLLLLDTPAPTGPSFLEGMLPFVVLAAIFYFLLYRPQAQKQKEHDAMVSALQKDDRVVMTGGLHGVVAEVQKDTIVVEVAGKTRLVFDKSAVGRKLDAAAATEAAK